MNNKPVINEANLTAILWREVFWKGPEERKKLCGEIVEAIIKHQDDIIKYDAI